MPGKLIHMQIAYSSDSEYLAKKIYKVLPEVLTERARAYEELLRMARTDREAYLKITREAPPKLRDTRNDIQQYLEEVYGCGYDDFCKLEKEVIFGNKEYKPKPENVRGSDIYFITAFKGYLNDDEPNVGLVKLILTLDALNRASSRSRVIVAPYLPYERQDRKDESRVPISFKAIASILERMGTTRILTMDMHAPQEQGFFDIPVDDLTPIDIVKPYIDGLKAQGPVFLVDPDSGSAKRNEKPALYLDIPQAILNKTKAEDGSVQFKNIVGVENIPGKTGLIMDDIIGTGRTVIGVAKELRKYNPAKIAVVGTTLLGNPEKITDKESGLDKLQACDAIDEIVVTDSNYSPDWKKYPKVKVETTAVLLANAIFETQTNGSVQRLFPY